MCKECFGPDLYFLQFRSSRPEFVGNFGFANVIFLIPAICLPVQTERRVIQVE